MTRVKLVEQNDLVRVVAMSEHAVEKTCKSWQEAMDYCEERQYTIENMEESLSRLLDTAEVPGEGAEEGGGHTPDFPATGSGNSVPGADGAVVDAGGANGDGSQP
jgi:hypothetical protein